MEKILRSQEMAEIILLPVRHHSPACAFHVSRAIEEIRPCAILVEGPDNANPLIPVMVHQDTEAPFAIYYSCNDESGLISGEKERYKCYYPFLDYSPELAALREGHRLGIRTAFIDLPYGDILAASEKGRGLLNREEEKNNYNDDYLLSRNEYWKQLCEKTGLRSFDEFWEKYFELNGLTQTEQVWFSNLLTYCALARENTLLETLEGEGCLARERYMAGRIAEYARAAASGQAPVLAVTGGFHTPALKKLLAGEDQFPPAGSARKDVKMPEKNQSVYLMPYSMEAADALNGYASGMPFPGFYQKIWEVLVLGDTAAPYGGVVLDMIVSSGKETRRKEGYLSTYDEICACSMAEGLAALRGKREPGAYELMDAVLSSFVKGEYNLSSDTPMRILKKRMTGKKVGKLCRQADVPPIIHDFEAQCRKFRLKIGSAQESESTLSIFSNKKHRQAGMFFHRMDFLGTAFARKVKGPNLQLKKDRNLIREIWKYKWSAQVNSALIDVSVYGGTLEEAAIGIVKEKLAKDMGAKEGALLLTHVFEMGLEDQLPPVYARVHELMLQDTDFYSLSDAMGSLLMMEELGELYGSPMEFTGLIRTGARKLISLLPSMTRIKDEDLTACMDTLKLLYRITGRAGKLSGQGDGVSNARGRHAAETQEPEVREQSGIGSFAWERDAYFDALDRMKQDGEIHGGLNGCVHGILYGSGRETSAEVEMICRGYLTGTDGQLMRTAQFFKGLFFAARDLVFIGDAFLGMLDTFFGQVTGEEFMELLPELRMAFAYFTPRETDQIARMAAGLHGKGQEDILEREEILPDWYAYGAEVDACVQAEMNSPG